MDRSRTQRAEPSKLEPQGETVLSLLGQAHANLTAAHAKIADVEYAVMNSGEAGKIDETQPSRGVEQFAHDLRDMSGALVERIERIKARLG